MREIRIIPAVLIYECNMDGSNPLYNLHGLKPIDEDADCSKLFVLESGGLDYTIGQHLSILRAESLRQVAEDAQDWRALRWASEALLYGISVFSGASGRFYPCTGLMPPRQHRIGTAEEALELQQLMGELPLPKTVAFSRN